jgi:hypothetical protein
MSRFESITIREVESSDLETFYEYQLDPEAIRMAAFVSKDPKDKVAFDAHWDKILRSSQNTRGRSWQRDKSLVTYRATRMERTWKSPIGLEGSSGEED